MEIGFILQCIITIGMFLSFILLVFFAVRLVRIDQSQRKNNEQVQRLRRVLLICAIAFLVFCAALFIGGKLNLPGWDYEIHYTPNQK